MIAAHVALAFMFLRALLPPGFMPDLQALRDGRIEITICSVDGARLVVLDRDSTPVKDKPAGHDEAGGLHCPFGLAAAQTFVLPDLSQLSLPRMAEAAALDRPTRQGTRPQVRGPPLGSRAPPTDIA